MNSADKLNMLQLGGHITTCSSSFEHMTKLFNLPGWRRLESRPCAMRFQVDTIIRNSSVVADLCVLEPLFPFIFEPLASTAVHARSYLSALAVSFKRQPPLGMEEEAHWANA